MNRILVTGVPRSGTTWVGQILGAGDDATFLDEPDNHLVFPFALRTKRRLGGGFYPALQPDDRAPEYELLWRHALGLADSGFPSGGVPGRVRRKASLGLLRGASKAEKWAAVSVGGSPSLRVRAAELLGVPERPRHQAATLVVKSVYASLAIEWIAARFPVRVVFVTRNLLDVLASWNQIDWLGLPGDDALDTLGDSAREQLARTLGVEPPARGESAFARAAWLIAALSCALHRAAERNPDWIEVAHEDLCTNPHERFRALAEALGRGWSASLDRLLDDLNRPGSGYEPFRVRSGLPGAWRTRLSRDQVDEAVAVLERFPLTAGSTPPCAAQ